MPRAGNGGLPSKTRAYAKVNLTLEVLGRRPDGYHEIRTVLQTIGLADTLHVSPGEDVRLRCSDPDLEGPGNLVCKAAEALRRASGESRGADMRLDKLIPVGMGLGGGSADAAAALLGLRRLWGLALEDARLRDIAADLGADVPFLLNGGTALGTGRGDRIEALPPPPTRWMVLVCPPGPPSGESGDGPTKTARLYSMMSPRHYTDGNRTEALAETLRAGGDTEPLLFNAFEPVALETFQGLAEAWSALRGAAEPYAGGPNGSGGPHLSGTGPAIYAFVPGKPEGENVVKTLQCRGVRAYLVPTINPDPHGEGT